MVYYIQKMVSVIILSYNTRDITLKCLDALKHSRGVEMETIVVDNASTDGSVEALKKLAGFQGMRLIVNKKNVGFAAGNNQGMKMAKGDYFLLLNSDCFVEPDTIQVLNTKCKELNFDAAGCKLKNQDGSLQPSWGYFPTLRRVTQLMLFVDNFPGIKKFIDSIYIRDPGRYTRPVTVDWVTGACLFVKREVFEETQGMDEKFFMYGEEVEWQYRIKTAGFKIGFVPEAEATHIGGASWTGKDRVFIGGMKGFIKIFQIHKSPMETGLLKLILLTGCAVRIPAWWVMGKMMNKPDLYRKYLKILPELWKEIISGIFGRTR